MAELLQQSSDAAWVAVMKFEQITAEPARGSLKEMI